MSIRLGANPIIWSNDDMRELGAETSLETCLAQARQIGFEGMELGHKFPRDPVELAAALDRFGLACVSGWYSAQLRARDARAEIAFLRLHLELLKAVGSSVLVFADVSGAIHGDLQRPELRNYSGWVILEAEQDPRIADPMTYASIGYNNLRRLLSENAQ
jgi:inosose dehydratase